MKEKTLCQKKQPLEHQTLVSSPVQNSGINMVLIGPYIHRWGKVCCRHRRAYWLLDEIAIIQPITSRSLGSISGVETCVHDDQTATLTCDDGNGNIVYTKQIPFTDFPLQEIKFYFTDNVILLPSEY